MVVPHLHRKETVVSHTLGERGRKQRHLHDRVKGVRRERGQRRRKAVDRVRRAIHAVQRSEQQNLLAHERVLERHDVERAAQHVGGGEQRLVRIAAHRIAQHGPLHGRRRVRANRDQLVGGWDVAKEVQRIRVPHALAFPNVRCRILQHSKIDEAVGLEANCSWHPATRRWHARSDEVPAGCPSRNCSPQIVRNRARPPRPRDAASATRSTPAP